MKHTSIAIARLLLSISVVITLISSVLPQFGFISSSVEANHRGSELQNQLDQLHGGTSQSGNSGSSGSPTQSESDNIGPVSTSSDSSTDMVPANPVILVIRVSILGPNRIILNLLPQEAIHNTVQACPVIQLYWCS